MKADVGKLNKRGTCLTPLTQTEKNSLICLSSIRSYCSTVNLKWACNVHHTFHVVAKALLFTRWCCKPALWLCPRTDTSVQPMHVMRTCSKCTEHLPGAGHHIFETSGAPPRQGNDIHSLNFLRHCNGNRIFTPHCVGTPL